MQKNNQFSEFKKYAIQYKCSVAAAIYDRDYPATEKQCVEWFIEAEGRNPSLEEIKEMRPDTQEKVDEEASLLRREMSDYY